jgi:hypothetical protein
MLSALLAGPQAARNSDRNNATLNITRASQNNPTIDSLRHWLELGSNSA